MVKIKNMIFETNKTNKFSKPTLFEAVLNARLVWTESVRRPDRCTIFQYWMLDNIIVVNTCVVIKAIH